MKADCCENHLTPVINDLIQKGFNYQVLEYGPDEQKEFKCDYCLLEGCFENATKIVFAKEKGNGVTANLS